MHPPRFQGLACSAGKMRRIHGQANLPIWQLLTTTTEPARHNAVLSSYNGDFDVKVLRLALSNRVFLISNPLVGIIVTDNFKTHSVFTMAGPCCKGRGTHGIWPSSTTYGLLVLIEIRVNHVFLLKLGIDRLWRCTTCGTVPQWRRLWRRLWRKP
jgi:hypothetical protein